MHSGHSYAVQSAAFYVALIRFILLFTMMIGARFFEALRRARKPAPKRPAIIGIAAFAQGPCAPR
jgi:hypothetical protein